MVIARDLLKTKRGCRSQEEIAALCQVTQQTYSSWERARSTPGIRKMIKLEKVLEEPKENLFPDIFKNA